MKVSTVEVKDVELPAEMQRAIARQAEADRERRAKVISADGEFQASAKLSQAADVMSRNPTTLQLRYLQTLLEMGVNQNTTIVFPLPIDLLRAFVRNDEDAPSPASSIDPAHMPPPIRPEDVPPADLSQLEDVDPDEPPASQ